MPSFPTLSTGAITQFPISYKLKFDTSVSEVESGQAYTYYNRATPKRGWRITFEAITQAEAEALQAFFEARKGKLETFSFTDPHSHVNYPVCRFGMDELTISEPENGIFQTTVEIEVYG